MIIFAEEVWNVYEDELINRIIPAMEYKLIGSNGIINGAHYVPGDIIGPEGKEEAITQVKCFTSMYYILFLHFLCIFIFFFYLGKIDTVRSNNIIKVVVVWKEDFEQEFKHGDIGDEWEGEIVRNAILVLDKRNKKYSSYQLGWSGDDYNDGQSLYYMEACTSLGWFALEKFLSDNYGY